MEAQTIIVRKAFSEKKNDIEKKLILICDLNISIEYLREELKECQDKNRKGVILSNLKHARAHLNSIKDKLAR